MGFARVNACSPHTLSVPTRREPLHISKGAGKKAGVDGGAGIWGVEGGAGLVPVTTAAPTADAMTVATAAAVEETTAETEPPEEAAEVNGKRDNTKRRSTERAHLGIFGDLRINVSLDQ